MKWVGVAAAAVVSAWAMNANAATIVENVTFNDSNLTYSAIPPANDPPATKTFTTSTFVDVPAFQFSPGDQIQLNVTFTNPINVTDAPFYIKGSNRVSSYDQFDFYDSTKPSQYGVGGNLSVNNYFTAVGGQLFETGYTSYSYAYQPLVRAPITLDSVAIEVAALPEPTVWTLLIAGFGLVGLALRRRRQGDRVPSVADNI